MKSKPNSSVTSPTLVLMKGQLWKFDNRCIRIEHVGQLLVEHRGVLPGRPLHRSPKRMIAIKELQRFLSANAAELIVD